MLPARNEGPRIGAVLMILRAMLADLDIVVVDDASSDDTAAAARRSGAHVVRHPVHLGYGAALKTGYTYALRHGHNACVQLDADGQHDATQVASLLGPVLAGEADIVIGSRFLTGDRVPMAPPRRVGSAVLRAVARLFGVRSTDPTSGFRALSARAMRFLVALPIPDDYPDVDVLIAIRRAGLVVREVPVPSIARVDGASMHSGVRPLYYSYKVAISALFAAWRTPPHAGPG